MLGAALVLVLVEKQRSEEGTDIVGGVGVVGGAQKVWTSQPLYNSLVPFDHRTLDSIGLEKSENARGSITRVLGGGGSGPS